MNTNVDRKKDLLLPMKPKILNKNKSNPNHRINLFLNK